MLMDRIIGAFTFRSGVYKEVEEDTAFTTTAWLLVVVIAFLNQLGRHASARPARWLIGSVLGTVFAVIAFAAAATIINWVGDALFNADVGFEELVRTLGLAYVWNVVGVVGVVTAFSGALSCLLAPARILAWVLGLLAWFVATKEALDLEWGETVVTVIVGWIAMFMIMAVVGVILGVLGLGAAVAGGLLRVLF